MEHDHHKYTIANWVVPIWQHPDPDLSAGKKRDVSSVSCGVLHTTGYGPGVQRLDQSDLSPDQVDLAYAQRLANILEYKCHLFIGRTGAVYQMAPIGFTAYHTGSKGSQAYKSDAWKKRKNKPMGWWLKRFGKLKSPLDFPHWANGSPNRVSWGIDLLAPRKGEDYTWNQLRSTAECVVLLAEICGHPLDQFHVATHSDVHPLDRTNKWGPWDLGPRWDREKFWEMVREQEATKGEAS